MRTLLLPLAVVSLLALVAPSRAEFDAAGNATAKPKATGTAFHSGVATTTRARRTWVIVVADDSLVGIFNGPLPFAIVRGPVVPVTPAPQPIIKNPSNIPRPKR
jgi:hypothetical protein